MTFFKHLVLITKLSNIEGGGDLQLVTMKRRGALAVPGGPRQKVPTVTPSQRVSVNDEVAEEQERDDANKAETVSKYVIIDVGGERFRAKRCVKLLVFRLKIPHTGDTESLDRC